MNSNYVGILVARSVYHGIPASRTNKEKLSFYNEACQEYGLIPCYLCLEEIKTFKGKVKAFVWDGHRYKQRIIPIPKVIHNRSASTSPFMKRKMVRLKKRGIIVFNGYYNVGKWQIHQLLNRNLLLRKHLPKTSLGTIPALHHMMRLYPTLLIKPSKGSLGIGIKKVEKEKTHWRLHYSKSSHVSFIRNIPTRLKRDLKQKTHLIQERVPLATVNGSPFDIRVSVQKDETGQWQITGMVAKVAAKGHYASNVYQGGSVKRLEEVLKLYPDLDDVKVTKGIKHLAITVAEQLNKFMNLADLGLDIGITEEGFPYFIECNRRDLRYSFEEAQMEKEWKATYRNPMGFAKYLLTAKSKRQA